MFERYVKCLMINRNSVEVIKRELMYRGFPPPSTDDLARIEAELIDGAEKDLALYLTNHKTKLKPARKKALNAFVIAQGFYEFFKNDAAIGKIEPILFIPEARYAIECLLVSNITREEIVVLANARWGLGLTKEDLVNYEHFYFDTGLLDTESWSYYLAVIEPPDAKLKGLALENPEDIARLKHFCGFPVQLDWEAMLLHHRDSAHFLIEECWAKGAPDTHRINLLTSLMNKMGAAHKKLEKPNIETAAQRMMARLQGSSAIKQEQAKIHIGPLPPIKLAKAPTKDPSDNLVPMRVAGKGEKTN